MHVYFCMKLSSDHQLCVAAAVRIFGDDDLPVDALFELRYVRDDADEAVSFREPRERLICLAERLGVERAEALVHKERVKMDACGHLHLVGKTKRQGQRRQKRFAAGERIDASLGRVDVKRRVERICEESAQTRTVRPLQVCGDGSGCASGRRANNG